MTKLWISAGLKNTSDKSASYVNKALIDLQKMTIKEQGCMQFDILQHRDDSKLFTLWEEWVNEQALNDHFKKDHTTAYLALQLTDVTYIEKLVKLS